jgi:Protein of unknown function (DUF2510)
MPVAAWCSECKANVWVSPEGACPNGHPRSSLRGLHEVVSQPVVGSGNAGAPSQKTPPAYPVSAALASAGWHPDSTGRHELRYWDGASWTEHVSDAGSQSRDPLVDFQAGATGAMGATHGGIWRSGNRLVMQANAVLPDRCVKTNQPVDGSKIRVRLRWHDPLFYLLILVSLLAYVIVAAFVSKKAVVWVGLSETAMQKRRWSLASVWVLVLSGLGAIVAMIAFGLSPFLFFVGIALIVLAYPVYVWGGARLVAPVRIKDGYLWLTGVHPDYLDLLPEWEQGPGFPQFT